MTVTNENGLTIVDRVVNLTRGAKEVKGGRRFTCSAVGVAGDGNGRVGPGLGKANEGPEAIRKGDEQAKKNLIDVTIVNGTIPIEIIGRYGASKIFLKPAAEGTGVIAGGAIKIVIESVGIKNILTKCLGSQNPHNAVKATFNALEQLRSSEDIQKKLARDE